MTVVALKTGQYVFGQGDRASQFYLLKEGRLRVTQVTEQGQQIIVRIVHPGEMFGFAPALGRDTYPGSCEAIMPSRVLAWPVSQWDAVVASAPALSLSTIRAVGRKLDEAHARLRDLATEEAPCRIARALLRLAEDAALDLSSPPVQFPFPLPRQDIAEMSGTTLHTASRIMARWQADGVLLPARGRVIIRDPAALQVIANLTK